MARFEGALAQASARAGVIPANLGTVISSVCEQASFDALALAKEARLAGTLAIPFVKALTAQVASVSAEAARYVHFGATSQDVLDTAAVVCLREASARIDELVVAVGDAASELARRHAATPMLARTLLQPALPAPFGWKACMWLAPFARALPHFRRAVHEGCVLQLGGAGGTLSAFGDQAGAVARVTGEILGLTSTVTWHSARDAFARLGSEMALLTGLAAKIARDVTLLMQPEIGEASEPPAPGRGGSSSMPHKRNPAISLLALEAAMRSPGLAATLLAQLAPEHERGIGQWQSQWLVLRSLAGAAASALAAMAEVLNGLGVHPEAMRANLHRTGGLVYSEAVSRRLGRLLADRLCEQAVREGRALIEVMRADAEVKKRIPAKELEALFEAERTFAGAEQMMERVAADWASARGSAP
jgi:3-carboxy-cis,cis-muconate cycloisomerase